MNSVLTTCPYCGSGCTLYLNVEEGRIVSVTPNATNAVNDGRLCLKGHFGFDFVHHRDRLTTPLVRKDGQLVPASWEEALGLVAAHIQAAPPDGVAAFSSARCTNEENYLMSKLMRAVVGTNNIDHCARL